MAPETSFKDSKLLLGVDWLAALTIFLLPLISIALSGINLPRWMINIMLVLFLGVMICALVLAVIRGFPRWSLSYLGFFLTIMAFYSLGLVLWGILFYPFWMLIFGPRDSWSLAVQLFYSGLMEAFTRFLVLLIALILIYLFRHWSDMHALWFRIREDWTYLSFLTYGGLVFYIWLTFDEYHYENPWTFSAFTCLAIGGLIYLLARGKNTRFLALVGGVTGAMWIIAIGKWIIVPLQNWPVDLAAERIFEFLRTIGSWVVMIAVMTAPWFLNLLPPAPSPALDEATTS